MGFTMSLNLILLLAMVATNILSLYHLSSTLHSPSLSLSPPPVPDHLLRQLSTIRATISHLTRLHAPPPRATSPPELTRLSLSSLPTACSLPLSLPLLHQYMSYTPFSLCPSLSTQAAEPLVLRGCHPLPRRRCFSLSPSLSLSQSLPTNPFSPLPEKAIVWSNYTCKSFHCLSISNSDLGFDQNLEKTRFLVSKSDLDLPIPQFLQIARTAKSPIRVGLDIGGGTGTFAAQMKLKNVTIVTTTMNLGAPFSETVALRGLVPLHVPLQQRLPVFDGVLDLVRCGRAVNRWIPLAVLEFFLYDVDRVLRGGGYLWVDRFFSKKVDFDKVYSPVFMRLGYKKVKWAVANKTDSSGVKNGEVYLTALLQKPVQVMRETSH